MSKTSLTYLLLENTDRDDVPAFQCTETECENTLTSLQLATHLTVHGAKTYKIDTSLVDRKDEKLAEVSSVA